MATSMEQKTFSVARVKTETAVAVLLGTSPLIMNRIPEPALQTLLFGGQRKTAAEKRENVKHDPLREYQRSMHLIDNAHTALGMPATAVKGALMTAALDTPGVAKTEIGRLVWVNGQHVPVWGVPQMLMAVVKSAGKDRIPDVRTRAILARWCTVVEITYVVPLLNDTVIVNLLSRAGITAGIGDWRQEKGKGNFGQFTVSDLNDPLAQELMANSGLKAQQAAIDNPQPYDAATAELYGWYQAELKRSGKG